MATLTPELTNPQFLGIPGRVPIPYHLECTIVVLQSLHALFTMLATGDALTHCPQAAAFAKALSTAAGNDNGHIASLASSLALALRSGRSTLAEAGVFGAGKTLSHVSARMAGPHHPSKDCCGAQRKPGGPSCYEAAHHL